MRRLLLVANPAASGFTGGAYRDAIRVLGEEYELEVQWPESGVGAVEAAAKAAANGFDVVAGMGGDGVVHRVANGIMGTSTALGIIPAGTTDVLARILKIPRHPAKAAAVLNTAPARPAPAAQYEAEGPQGRVGGYALFALGAGLDAEVVKEAESTPHRKTWFGGLYYARRAASMFVREFRKREATMEVATDDLQLPAVAVLTQIRWPYTYFGPVPLRLTSKPADRLTLGVIEKAPLLRAGALATTSLIGRGVGRVRGISVLTGRTGFTVRADAPIWLQADGELLGEATGLRVVFQPDMLQVISP